MPPLVTHAHKDGHDGWSNSTFLSARMPTRSEMVLLPCQNNEWGQGWQGLVLSLTQASAVTQGSTA